MYCPQCKSEYKEGIAVCAECEIPLMESLPEGDEEFEEEEESDIKLLLETTHPTTLDPIVVKLEERGIPYVVQSGTALAVLEGRLTATLPEDWRGVLLVPTEHFEVARAVMTEVESQTVADEGEQE